MTGKIALLQTSSLDKVQEVIVMTDVDVDGRCYLRERVTNYCAKQTDLPLVIQRTELSHGS